MFRWMEGRVVWQISDVEERDIIWCGGKHIDCALLTLVLSVQ